MKAATTTHAFFCIAVFVHCRFFCSAVFFALQLFLHCSFFALHFFCIVIYWLGAEDSHSIAFEVPEGVGVVALVIIVVVVLVVIVVVIRMHFSRSGGAKGVVRAGFEIRNFTNHAPGSY